jgi:hypothetical protein
LFGAWTTVPDSFGKEAGMNEFLSFRKMITPVIIQVLFWIGVAVCVISGLVTMIQGGSAAVRGLLMLLLGPIVVRVYCELLILLFRIHDAVDEIRRGKASPSGQAGFPVNPAP